MSDAPTVSPDHSKTPQHAYPWPRTGQRYVFSRATLAVHGLYEFLTLDLVAARLWRDAGPEPVAYSATWVHDYLVFTLGLASSYASISQKDLTVVGYPTLSQ